MGRQDFGGLVQQRRKAKRWSQGRLGVEIGVLPSGTYLDATGVRNLEEGKRAIETDPELFDRVLTLLDIDRDEAYVALGLLPPGVGLNDIRKLRGNQSGTRRRRRADREVPTNTAPTRAAVRASSQQGDSTMGTWTVPAGSRAEVVAA